MVKFEGFLLWWLVQLLITSQGMPRRYSCQSWHVQAKVVLQPVRRHSSQQGEAWHTAREEAELGEEEEDTLLEALDSSRQELVTCREDLESRQGATRQDVQHPEEVLRMYDKLRQELQYHELQVGQETRQDPREILQVGQETRQDPREILRLCDQAAARLRQSLLHQEEDEEYSISKEEETSVTMQTSRQSFTAVPSPRCSTPPPTCPSPQPRPAQSLSNKIREERQEITSREEELTMQVDNSMSVRVDEVDEFTLVDEEVVKEVDSMTVRAMEAEELTNREEEDFVTCMEEDSVTARLGEEDTMMADDSVTVTANSTTGRGSSRIQFSPHSNVSLISKIKQRYEGGAAEQRREEGRAGSRVRQRLGTLNGRVIEKLQPGYFDGSSQSSRKSTRRAVRVPGWGETSQAKTLRCETEEATLRCETEEETLRGETEETTLRRELEDASRCEDESEVRTLQCEGGEGNMVCHEAGDRTEPDCEEATVRCEEESEATVLFEQQDTFQCEVKTVRCEEDTFQAKVNTGSKVTLTEISKDPPALPWLQAPGEADLPVEVAQPLVSPRRKLRTPTSNARRDLLLGPSRLGKSHKKEPEPHIYEEIGSVRGEESKEVRQEAGQDSILSTDADPMYEVLRPKERRRHGGGGVRGLLFRAFTFITPWWLAKRVFWRGEQND